MTSLKDPIRLLDGKTDLSNSLQQALKAGRSVKPTAEQLDDLSGRLAPLLAKPPTMPRSDTVFTGDGFNAYTTNLGWGKSILALAVVAVMTPGLFYAWKHFSQDDTKRSAPEAAKKQPTEPESRMAQDETITLSSDPPVVVDPPVRKAEVPSKVRTPRHNRSNRSVVPKAGNSNSNDADMNQELRLIQKARSYLRLAPRKALSLTEQHRRQFENGMFVQEREIVAIEALVLVGDIEQARVRAAAMLKKYPYTAYKRRIEILIR